MRDRPMFPIPKMDYALGGPDDPSLPRTIRGACRATHPLVPHVVCSKRPGHRGKHAGQAPAVGAPPAWVRWER
jgi:hypothetical protein